jgi:peptidylamidoglycolate lyase
MWSLLTCGATFLDLAIIWQYLCRFYLPHGLTVDANNNVWVTDVAQHQIFKFPQGGGKALLTLGVAFVPGNDYKHFCKPTAVAVMSDGDFFVSDGYCNSRIIKFDKNGNFLMQWGRNAYDGTVSNFHFTCC